MEKNKFYITTAIDYVNASPHVGHAVEKIQADVIARWMRNRNREVYFLTGSDENALKNVQSAIKAGKEVAEFVSDNSKSFMKLKEELGLSYDYFIRTTEKRHFKGAQKFWQALNPADIEKRFYEGCYCVGCEEFKMEKDLVDGKCPEHGTVPEKIKEENYFFKLSNYQEKLQELIESDKLMIRPTFRKHEVLGFIKKGLEDFSISRSKERAKNWGVPVPGDENQIMYVWVDALANYITALDYDSDGELYQKYWESSDKRVHLIGKGILRFHAIYWPALLMSAKLPLPTEILCHEYLTINGKKISKSLGNVINPGEVVEKFGIDGARYVLLSSLPYRSDGDLTWERMTEKYNADLANGLGNLLSRIVKLSEKTEIKFTKMELGHAILDNGETAINKSLEDFNLEGALTIIAGQVRNANKYIEDNKPWELAKNDQQKFEEVMKKLNLDLLAISKLISPFIPETSEKIKKALETKKPTILFQRIK